MGIIRLTIMSLCGTKNWPVRHLKPVHNITLFLSPTSWLNFSPTCQVDVKPLTHYKPPNYFRPFFHSKDVKPKRTAIVSGNAECKNRLRYEIMKNSSRLILTKEIIYYILGILLIFGFVYLYWGHFTDTPGPPAAIRYIMYNWGRKAAMAINAAVFLLFILFLPFRDRLEWRSKGVLSAFILALFTEMFGLPLLIFLLQPLGADNQLWDAIGLGQIKSSVYYFSKHWPTRAVGVWMTLIGMLLVFFGWMKIHKASGLVTDGIYRYIRHPQYTGIFLIITGWMFRWLNPTLLIMYPILLILYYRLARREEQQVLKEYGDSYLKYKEATPMFFPIKFSTASRKNS
jgi:protein-S-isoprenylcysteine O-methyltransferase Ste14